MDVALVAYVFGAARVLIGLGAIFAIDRLAPLFGFPRDQLTPTMRLFARLFGNRDIGLGVILFAAAGDLPWLRLALLFNAAHDLLDAAVIAPLIQKPEIRTASLICLACATSGVVLFVSAWWWTFL